MKTIDGFEFTHDPSEHPDLLPYTAEAKHLANVAMHALANALWVEADHDAKWQLLVQGACASARARTCLSHAREIGEIVRNTDVDYYVDSDILLAEAFRQTDQMLWFENAIYVCVHVWPDRWVGETTDTALDLVALTAATPTTPLPAVLDAMDVGMRAGLALLG